MIETIRVSETDYDGDGDVTEGIAGEIDTIAEALLVAIQAYANENPATDPIVYDSHGYPYFFIDTNADGTRQADENGIASVTVNLLDAVGTVLATQVTDGYGRYQIPRQAMFDRKCFQFGRCF